MKSKRVALFYGTRPEIIKVAPVISALKKEASITLTVVNTGQHLEISREIEEVFSIRPDITLDTFVPGQQLDELFSKIFKTTNEFLVQNSPDLVLIQGDTSTVLAVSIACFYKKIPVGHIEAGLRSGSLTEPFPEEYNRKVTTIGAQLHFAPTQRAYDNLILENVQPQNIFITGNTIVDACNYVKNKIIKDEIISIKQILVTAHRRENHDTGLKNICDAIKRISYMHPDIQFLWPMHPNKAIQNIVKFELSSHRNVLLTSALNYLELLSELNRSIMVWSDSGGIQEEVPTFKKPILILRNKTERPEVIEEGFGVLVGTEVENIVKYANELIEDNQLYLKMTSGKNPFGDGTASIKIVNEIKIFLNI